MTERYIFFNSAPGDARTYQAADFADYFGSVLSTGLLHTDNVPGMVVSVESGTLNTIVSTGKAIMNGHLYENTAPLTLTHSIPEASLDRIDRIVLRLDLRNSERNIKLHVKEGVPSATPVAPALQRDNFIYEIALARITLWANTSQVFPSDLVDERLDENLAGLVHSLISIPTSQFQAEWDAFMEDVQDSGFASGTEFAAHKADDTSHVRYGSASGTDSKIVTLNPAPTSLVEGFALSFKNTVANTGASTLNVNGLGAKPIVKSNGIAVASGNLKAGSIYTVRYDGASFILQGEGASGNATASDLLSGKTASTDAGDIVGTMPNRGAFNLGLGVPVPEGYYSGGTTAAGKKWASGSLPDQTIRLNDPQKIILDNNLDFNIGTVIIKTNIGNFYCAYGTVYGTAGWLQSGPNGFSGSNSATGIYAISPNPTNKLNIATRGGTSGSTQLTLTGITWIALEA